MKEIAALEIIRYHFDMVEGDPKIVIEMIKAVDKDGKYIKFISMKEAMPLLAVLPCKFKAL